MGDTYAQNTGQPGQTMRYQSIMILSHILHVISVPDIVQQTSEPYDKLMQPDGRLSYPVGSIGFTRLIFV